MMSNFCWIIPTADFAHGSQILINLLLTLPFSPGLLLPVLPSQAECVYVSPGNASCLCAEGWVGDGLVCLEINNCQLNTRGGCSANADCNHVGPGQVSQSPRWMMFWPVISQGVSVGQLPTAVITPHHLHPRPRPPPLCLLHFTWCIFALKVCCFLINACLPAPQHTCVCKTGFMGNGKVCDRINPCTINYGGCHQLVRSHHPHSVSSTRRWLILQFTRETLCNLPSGLIAAMNRFWLPTLVTSDTCCQNSLCTTRLQSELTVRRSSSKSTPAS